jgi:hypothetical protein
VGLHCKTKYIAAFYLAANIIGVIVMGIVILFIVITVLVVVVVEVTRKPQENEQESNLSSDTPNPIDSIAPTPSYTPKKPSISSLINLKVLPNTTTVSYDLENPENVGKRAYLYYYYPDVYIIGTDFIKDKSGIDSLKQSHQLSFKQEPDNAVDANAVLFVDENDCPIGYINKGRLHDMINDYISRGDIVIAIVKDVESLLVEVGFYKFEPYKLIVSVNSSKNKYQDNLSSCSEYDEVKLVEDYETEKTIVMNDVGEELGVVSNDDIVDCRAYIHSYDYTDSGKMKIKIAVQE